MKYSLKLCMNPKLKLPWQPKRAPGGPVPRFGNPAPSCNLQPHSLAGQVCAKRNLTIFVLFGSQFGCFRRFEYNSPPPPPPQVAPSPPPKLLLSFLVSLALEKTSQPPTRFRLVSLEKKTSQKGLPPPLPLRRRVAVPFAGPQIGSLSRRPRHPEKPAEKPSKWRDRPSSFNEKTQKNGVPSKMTSHPPIFGRGIIQISRGDF